MKTNLLIVLVASALVLINSRAAENPPTPNASAATPAAKPSPAPGERPPAGPAVATPAAADRLNILWTTQDQEVQDYLKRMQAAGVGVLASRAWADQYGVSKALEALGIEVKYMGAPLTEILKRGEKLMTF